MLFACLCTIAFSGQNCGDYPSNSFNRQLLTLYTQFSSFHRRTIRRWLQSLVQCISSRLVRLHGLYSLDTNGTRRNETIGETSRMDVRIFLLAQRCHTAQLFLYWNCFAIVENAIDCLLDRGFECYSCRSQRPLYR
jgi:hypothetical protein